MTREKFIVQMCTRVDEPTALEVDLHVRERQAQTSAPFSRSLVVREILGRWAAERARARGSVAGDPQPGSVSTKSTLSTASTEPSSGTPRLVSRAVRNDRDGGARVGRADFATLDRVGALERTPTGGIRVPARIARTGVLVYQMADGSTVREYRPPEEAFRAESLASLQDAVVTLDHPRSRLVTPDTARSVSVGHVREVGHPDGKFVATSLAILDGATIDAIDKGQLQEISAGYECLLDPTPGTTPEGEPYSVIQRQVLYNHIALGPSGWGRAGGDVSLRLDGLEVRIGGGPDPVIRVDSMKVRIDGREYEVGSPEWAAANAAREARRDAELEEATSENEELKTKLADAIKVRDGLQAALDAATASIESMKKDLGEATDETKMDARIAARASLFAQAKSVLGAEAKLDGKTSDAVRREVIVKLDGEATLVGPDGKPRGAEYVETYFGARMKAFEATSPKPISPSGLARRDAVTAPPAATHLDPVSPFDLSTR